MNAVAENAAEQQFYLSDLIGKKILNGKEKIGKLYDLVVKENGAKFPVVTHIIVGRPFGDHFLLIEWEKVVSISQKEITVNIGNIFEYEKELAEKAILLRDYILDKKILDVTNREVEIVYDIKLVENKNKLYVTSVDTSRGRLLKRMKLGFLANDHPEAVKNATLSWLYIQPLENISSFSGDIKLKVLREKLAELPSVDLADVLEVLEEDERTELFASLDTKTAAAALDATEPRIQRQILSTISLERIAQIFNHLSPMEIADMIWILPQKDSEEIKQILNKEVAEKVKKIISEYDIPASTLALHRYLVFPSNTLVEDAFTRYRKEAPKSDVTMYIYVKDDEEQLKGVIDINELLQADPNATLEQIMTRHVVTVRPSTMRGELEVIFRKYRFRALPVIDESRKIVGVVREKDVFQESPA
ncbi:MAG TPA: CBS domain-containing protein [Candidatus Acidoferrum sp.]|nr:CBS domain-containing protein [Candidatus Acidoferrum sp.]